jgi:hypothetical protein
MNASLAIPAASAGVAGAAALGAAATAAVVEAPGGCEQATRHANATMAFMLSP